MRHDVAARVLIKVGINVARFTVRLGLVAARVDRDEVLERLDNGWVLALEHGHRVTINLVR